MLRLAACLLLPLLPALVAPAPPAADELEEAVAAFVRVSAAADLEEKKAALERLIGFGDDDAVAPLVAGFAQVSTRLRDARDEAFRRRYALERRRAVLADLERRSERDPSLERVVSEEKDRVSKLEQELAKEEQRVAELGPWLAALGEGAARLFDALAAGERRKAEGGLWKDAEDAPELETRLAAVEMLGRVGGPGTAGGAADLIEAVSKQRATLRRDVEKQRGELRKLEQRMQKEQEQLEGRMSQALAQQYERARQDSARAQRALTLTSYLLDAAVEAGARALEREEEKELDRSLGSLLRAQRSARDGARLRLLSLLGRANAAPVRAALHELLAGEKDAAARAELIDALAATGDRDLVPRLLDTYLLDPSWHVRSRAAAGLARLRVREAIPALIARLEAEDGRVRTDFGAALTSLTGRDFHGNVELWRRWWKDHEESFVVPEVAEVEEQASEEARERAGTTFFGIETESDRVLFVLDLSGSMEFSIVPRDNPDDDPNRDPDKPRGDELSRLTAAKRELVKALGGIDEGADFNLVLYASDVWTWQDGLVEMDVETRAAAVRFVEDLSGLGGTNIHGALELALDVAGAEAGDSWASPAIDTIFLLSDGRPSVGLTTDPDEILAYVRERNRSAGIVIHTIGISGAQDAYLLRNLAEQNRGVYAAR